VLEVRNYLPNLLRGTSVRKSAVNAAADMVNEKRVKGLAE
jgi:hypothetical protein